MHKFFVHNILVATGGWPQAGHLTLVNFYLMKVCRSSLLKVFFKKGRGHVDPSVMEA